ncbi:serine O-acetyltransferase EpsC [Kushneria marisflavi]|uniref:serine O-acetyltransferase n=1 Tax=Kushneria marisflavi TaxID=157779 RepID=A0A240UTF6_9GAMM|nr:serine O-acetyltransferase EpsC [Kushneria marisflavi]ART64309.1 serine acetyltransferase [Kushneria marisflavi]RKD76776.1 serine O-acetyltransferase [Kushneria marisflavi]
MARLNHYSKADHAIDWQLDSVVHDLRDAREQWRADHGRTNESGGRSLPSREIINEVVEAVIGAVFPMRLGPSNLRHHSEDYFVGYTLDAALNALLDQVLLELDHTAMRRGEAPQDHSDQAINIVRDFGAMLPTIRHWLDIDIMAAYRGDPAARSVDEVLLCYPGITAIIYHRLAHQLYSTGAPLLARMVSEAAHSATGIDIHPGASIGSGFFIDHGTGVVIGETAIIGDRVRIYQAVTLGAKRFPADENGQLEKGHARHPIVENDVVIYAGATILGRVTIGHDSIIGGNVWLTRSVEPHSNVSQASLQKSPC